MEKKKDEKTKGKVRDVGDILCPGGGGRGREWVRESLAFLEDFYKTASLCSPDAYYRVKCDTELSILSTFYFN